MDEDLVRDGRFARLETRGRRTGDRRSVTIGFVAGDDGSLFVAAGGADAAWAANLVDDPTATVTIGARTWLVAAELLDDRDPRRGRAVRELILRYGTPSEGLGSGPVFVLRPAGS